MNAVNRRTMVAGLVVLTLGAAAGCDGPPPEAGVAADSVARTVRAVAAANPSLVSVYKTPACPCCTEWVEHLRDSGFEVEVHDVSAGELAQIRAREGVAAELTSCHTSTVGGYVLEGHVPADVVQQLLEERPQLRGLAVPGMPSGVPGMPDPGPNRPPFQVVTVQENGASQVYATR